MDLGPADRDRVAQVVYPIPEYLDPKPAFYRVYQMKPIKVVVKITLNKSLVMRVVTVYGNLIL